MLDFTLSRPEHKVFPVTVETRGGDKYRINANFRNILKILRLNNDDEVMPEQKTLLALYFFYTDNRIPPDTREALELMNGFITPPSKAEDSGGNGSTERQYDYEYDAEDIYASFLAEYKIDLLEVEFLHWYKFMVLLHYLSPESVFKKKIQLRLTDTSEMKGKYRASMERAKQSVQIPDRLTREQIKRNNEFIEQWG